MFRFFKILVLIFLITGFSLKTLPMLTGGVFPDSADSTLGGFSATSGVDFHHVVPSYVRSFLQETNNDFEDTRILMLPDGRFNNYYWGAGGAGDFLFDNVAFISIYRDFGEGFSGKSNHKAVIEDLLIELSSREKNKKVKNKIALTLKKLRINGILVRLDLNCETSQCRISKSESVKIGEYFFKKKNVFGKWVFFHGINEKLIKSNLDFVSLEKFLNIGFIGNFEAAAKNHFSVNFHDFYHITYKETPAIEFVADDTFGVTIESPGSGRVFFIHRASIYFLVLFAAFFAVVATCFVRIFKVG